MTQRYDVDGKTYEFPDDATPGEAITTINELEGYGPSGRPLFAGKAKGEEPQLAGLQTTGGIEGVLSSEPEDVTPGPITGGPDDSSVAYGPQKPQPQVPLLDRIASYFKAPQEQPPPGIANKPDIARLWAQQQTENAGIPSDATLALKSGLGILPWAAQTPPLAVPAKPGVPLTPTGQPIQTTEPTGQAIDYVLGKGQQASRAVAEHFIPPGPPQPNTNEEVLGGEFAPNSADILANVTDPGLRELGRQIISATQPTTTAPGFAAAMVQPEMVGLAAAGGMLRALKQAKLAEAVGRAAVSYFSAEGAVGGVKAAEVLADPNATDEARAAAIAQIPTSVIMAALAPMHAAVEMKAREAEDVARAAEGKDLFASIEADKAREETQPPVVPPPEPPVVPAEPGPIQRGTVQTPQITDADRAYLEAQTPAPEQPTVPPVAEPAPPPVVTERQQIPASADVLSQPPLEGSIQRWADQNAKTLVSNDEVRLRKSLPQQISAGNVPDEALDWVRDMGSREEAKTAGNAIRDRILGAKKAGLPQAQVRSLKTLEQLVWMKEKALAPYDSITKSASADRLEKYLEARRAINVEHERVLADRAKRDVSDFVAEAEKAPAEVFSEPIAKELATDQITPEEIALAERSLHEADSAAEGAEAATPPYRPSVGERGAEAPVIPEAAAPAPQEVRPEDRLQQPGEAVYAGEPEPGAGRLVEPGPAGPRGVGAVEPAATDRFVAAAPPVRGAHGVGAAAAGEAPEVGSRLFPFAKSNVVPQPKLSFDKMAEAKDVFGGYGLNQLEEASPKAAEQARYTASSLQKSTKLVSNAIPHLERDLGGGIGSVENFFTALGSSRLEGISDKYNAMIDSVEKMPDKELLDGAKEGVFNLAVNALDGRRGFGDRDLENEFNTSLERAQASGDTTDLRTFLADTFNTAEKNRSRAVLGDGEELGHYLQRQEVKSALATYKRLLEEPLKKAHAMNEGYFSKFLGPADTYFPLSQAPDLPSGKRLISTARAPYAKPKNPNNAFATGLSDQYDTGVDAFRDNLARSIRMNGRAGLVSTLEESGLLKRLKQGAEPPETTMWNGEEYKARTVDTGIRSIINKDGKVVKVVSPRAVVPDFVAKELNTILEPKIADEDSTLRKITDAVTTFNMGGPTDAVYHTANLVGTMILRAPIVGTDIISKTASATPFTKFVGGLANILAVDPLSPKWADRYMEMVENGQIPTRAGSVTYSKKLAETTGAAQVNFLQAPWYKNKEGKLKFRSPSDWSPIIFGPKGIDIRSRLLLDAIGEHIAKNTGIEMTPGERFEWTRQLGNYVYQLEGRIERSAKSTGLAPFYTAGRQMNWNGIVGMLAGGRLPVGEGMKAQTFNRYRAMMITSGLVGLTASWAVANKVYRDKWPWEDSESRLFQIAIKPTDREGKLARLIWGDDLARTGWVNLGVFSPLIARGLRITGARGLAENWLKGMPASKGVDQASVDILNGWLHPFLGPPARTATALLGFEPSIQSLTNQGRSQPLFRSTIRGKTEPGLAGWGQRLGQVALQSNPIFRRIQQGKQEEHPATRTLADTLVPNLFSGPYWQQDTPLDTFLREHAMRGGAKSADEMKQQERVRGFESRLRTAHAAGETDREAEIKQEIRAAAAEKKIPPHEVPEIGKKASVGKHAAGFAPLPFRDAVEAFEIATPEQRQELRMAMIKKLAAARTAIGRGRGGALQDMEPADRMALFQKAQGLIKDTSPAPPLAPVGRLFRRP